MSTEYELLRVERDGRAAWVTIDAPPVHVMTTDLFAQLAACTDELADDDELTAVILQSADPDFFIAHFDVAAILEREVSGRATRNEVLKPFHQMVQRWRTMPKATIAKVAGRVGGGGAELCASMDMRFGLDGKTVLNQMEVPIGILPGGGGTQRIPGLTNRGRALEVVLGGGDIDAGTLDRWGWLNRSFPTAAELDAHVDGLARRIASFPPYAVRLAKEAVGYAEPDPVPGLREEAYLFDVLMRSAEAPVAMQRFLDFGGQTREGESRVGELNAEVGRSLLG